MLKNLYLFRGKFFAFFFLFLWLIFMLWQFYQLVSTSIFWVNIIYWFILFIHLFFYVIYINSIIVKNSKLLLNYYLLFPSRVMRDWLCHKSWSIIERKFIIFCMIFRIIKFLKLLRIIFRTFMILIKIFIIIFHWNSIFLLYLNFVFLRKAFLLPFFMSGRLKQRLRVRNHLFFNNIILYSRVKRLFLDL